MRKGKHEGRPAPLFFFLLPLPFLPPPSSLLSLSLSVSTEKGKRSHILVRDSRITSRTFRLLWDSRVVNSRAPQAAPLWDAGVGGSRSSRPLGGHRAWGRRGGPRGLCRERPQRPHQNRACPIVNPSQSTGSVPHTSMARWGGALCSLLGVPGGPGPQGLAWQPGWGDAPLPEPGMVACAGLGSDQ